MGVKSLHTLGQEYRTLQDEMGSATERLIKVAYEGVQAFGLEAFATEVGEPVGKIREYVEAHQAYLDAEGARTANDALELSRLKGDRRIATEAVAQAWGVSLDNARKRYKDMVKEVMDAVADYKVQLAEASPADREDMEEPEDYALRLAKVKHRKARAAKERRQRIRDEAGEALHALTGHLSDSLYSTRQGVTVVKDSELPEGYGGIVKSYTAKIRAGLDLIDMAADGVVEFDWDDVWKKLEDPA